MCAPMACWTTRGRPRSGPRHIPRSNDFVTSVHEQPSSSGQACRDPVIGRLDNVPDHIGSPAVLEGLRPVVHVMALRLNGSGRPPDECAQEASGRHEAFNESTAHARPATAAPLGHPIGRSGKPPKPGTRRTLPDDRRNVCEVYPAASGIPPLRANARSRRTEHRTGPRAMQGAEVPRARNSQLAQSRRPRTASADSVCMPKRYVYRHTRPAVRLPARAGEDQGSW